MKVFITYKIPEAGVNKLKEAGHKVVMREEESLVSRDELVAALKEYDAVLSLLTDKIGAEEIGEAGGQLKIIANYAVGYDNIDVKAAAAKGIVVTNTPGVLTEAVVGHTIALMTSLARRIVEADQFIRDGKYEGWRPMLLLGTELQGKTLGVIGLGRIGSGVGKQAQAGLGMKVAYSDLKPSDEFEQATGAKFYPELDTMLPEVDVLSLHVPLVEATRHLINKERLGVMKKTALLINTSRGPVVDEAALVTALQNKEITGAALDVLENEPELAPGLAECTNVILTPHTASATQETRSAMSELAADNIIAVLADREALTPVEV
ncbi:MAG: D-glycerate dehydrogenase [bacterium]